MPKYILLLYDRHVKIELLIKQLMKQTIKSRLLGIMYFKIA